MKSHERELTELALHVLEDVHAVCATLESAVRDAKTLASRVEHEGLSFLTITLPSFGVAFEKSLSQGQIDPNDFRMFKKSRQIPAFLQGIVGLVFDADTGRIQNEPSVEAIKGIRQVAYAFKKLKLACSSARTSRAFLGFYEDEHDLEVAISQEDTDYFDSVCKCLWYGISDTRITSSLNAIPKHGPGATAEKLTGNRKYSMQRWHDRLESYFPMLNFVFSNENAYGSSEFERVSVVMEPDEQPVRVITVPKTLKAPRIIAIEPVCMQYAQQALSRVLVEKLEKYRLTKGHVNFTDQNVNRQLAMNSSKSGLMATLDLSSASDRVPLSLVGRMFQWAPEFFGAIVACRSRRALMPSGDVLNLKKFASMGSALCFPIESMYFYTICVGALLRKHNLPVTFQNVERCCRNVYVYGDDIIVPTDDVATVIDHLQKYYCKVGHTKSFWTGKFRESCGMDAYDGRCVTPTYIRMLPPNDRRDASALISWVQTGNQFEQNCYWSTASFLLKRCERILGKLPSVGGECAGLGRLDPSATVNSYGHHVQKRYNRRYHCLEVKTWVPTPVYRTDRLDGYLALTKCLLNLESRLSNATKVQSDHLVRTARYGAVTLKRRWVRPY